MHHHIFPWNEDLQGDVLKNKGDDFFEDLFHVTPPLFSGSGEFRKAIERYEDWKHEEIYTCLYGEDYLPRIEGFINDRNHQQLASFEEAARELLRRRRDHCGASISHTKTCLHLV